MPRRREHGEKELPISSSSVFENVLHQITSGSTLPFALLVLTVVLAPRIAEWLRLPGMVGLVLIGMALGPHGLHLLATKEIALQSLGNFGLLYLMFSAGLELDLKLFVKMKRAAITFALLSFAFPFTLGVVSAKLLHYNWPAAVLMGSNWGSHTLVTYSLLRSMGLARNRAVSTVVGATAVTDTSALLVLSVVSGTVKPTGSMAMQLVMIAIDLAVLVSWSLLALPVVARWFFARVGPDRSYRFVFGIAAFLVGGVIAEAGGIDAIVGAFFAGLGLNRAIPEESPLMDRLQFMGSTLFIPIFLVSVGVLLEPKVMIDPKTLLIALVFTVAVLGGKALAAVVAGRAFRFTWPEIGVMSGLSGSQAAATLATTLVGAKLGLFDKETINAVLVVILVSLVVTPAMVSFFGKRVTSVTEEAKALGKVVLVPVWGESSRQALSLAGRLATADGGIVVAASFVRDSAPKTEVDAHRTLTRQAEEWLAKEGFESKTLFRVAPSVPRGLSETALGEEATLVIGEWRDPLRDLHGSEAAEALAHAPVPVLIVRGDVSRFERLVVIAGPDVSTPAGRLDMTSAAWLAMQLPRSAALVAVATAPDSLRSLFPAKRPVEWIESRDPVGWSAANLREGDLPVFVGTNTAYEAMRQTPALLDRRFLIVQGEHLEGALPKPEPVSGPVVNGRSLNARHA
ncbi:MAG TPA: cation:proton antiporter [Polyangia bacterium]|nr:cation:proton antiporter [Polyangia bacterium]